jgi:hypothetical protein
MWRLALPLVGLAACRFGGPSADPNTYVAYPPDASGADGGTTAPPGDDGSVQPSGADDTGSMSGDDSTSGGDASNGDDAVAPGGDSEGGSCSPMVSVCDPVHNTGCTGQQCDVNPLSSASAPTGTCILFGTGASDAGIPNGSACFASPFNESCPAKSTCFNGACQELCFCDPDCPTGHCCSNSGPPGFKVCGSCSP